MSAFLHFHNLVKHQFGSNIKVLRSDNGGEVVKVHRFCSQSGILSQYSCPYTSAQNGRAE